MGRSPPECKPSAFRAQGQAAEIARAEAWPRRSEHAAQRIPPEQVAFLDVGGEGGVALVTAELLELGRMHATVLRGVHGAVLQAALPEGSSVGGCGAAAHLDHAGYGPVAQCLDADDLH